MSSSIGRDDLSRELEVDEDRKAIAISELSREREAAEDRKAIDNNERPDMTCGRRGVAIGSACEG